MVVKCLSWILVAALMGACAGPVIDTTKYGAPKSVVIADFPDMNSIAVIAPMPIQIISLYYAADFDDAFAPPSAIAGASNGIRPVPNPIGGGLTQLIFDNAERTQLKATDFPKLVRNTMQGADLRVDFLTALRQALEARHIEVRMAEDSRNLRPRLRWPARNAKGESLPTGPLADSPAVDADLLVQVAPVAFFSAPGPMNMYRRKVGVGPALYDGRTRQFLGWQAIPYDADGNLEYITYESLAADVDRASRALHEALMSLVPQVARIIAADRVAAQASR